MQYTYIPQEEKTLLLWTISNNSLKVVLRSTVGSLCYHCFSNFIFMEREKKVKLQKQYSKEKIF